MFYLNMLSLRTCVYFDYVPSKASIADLPSRNMFTELDAELVGIPKKGLSPDLLVVPSVAKWLGPLPAWVVKSPAAADDIIL